MKPTTETKKTDAYDFSLRKITKDHKADYKPLRPELMAKALKDAHGLEGARNLVRPFATSPTSAEFLIYWKNVYSYLNTGTKNATAS